MRSDALGWAVFVAGVVLISIVEGDVVRRYGLFYLVNLPFRQQLYEFMRVHWRELKEPQRSMYWGGLLFTIAGFVILLCGALTGAAG